jgi:hypothetical protein
MAGIAALAGCGTSPSSSGAANEKPSAQAEPAPAAQPALTPLVKNAAKVSEPKSAPKVAPAGSDPYAVPSGGTRELLQFVEQLRSRRLEGKSVEEQRESYRKTQHALVAALDRLLRSDIDPSLRLHLTHMKLNALADLMRLGEQDAKTKFFTFARESLGQAQRVMLAAKDEPLRVAATDLRLNALWVLSGEGDESSRREFLQFASETTDGAQPQAARTAMRLTMDFHLRDLEKGKRTDAKPIVELVKKQLSSPRGSEASGASLSVNDLAMAIHRLSQLEQLGLVADARVLHKEVQSAFAGASEELRAEAERQLESIGTRLNLVGKPLTIEGRLSDGRPLDWDAYRGKVVLVDFWTSWGRQNEREQVNQAKARVAPSEAGKESGSEILSTLDRVRRLYEKHHADGFEVIGVNLEKVPGDIERFLGAEKLPWPNVTNLPGSARGTAESNAARCGVDSPPMSVLVDRFGRVVKVGVLNERFEKRVADTVQARGARPLPKKAPGSEK